MADNSVIKEMCVVNLPVGLMPEYHLNPDKISKKFFAVETCARFLYVGKSSDLQEIFPADLLEKSKSLSLDEELKKRNEYMKDYVRIEHDKNAYSLLVRFILGVEGPRVSDYHAKSQIKTSFIKYKDINSDSNTANFVENVLNYAYSDTKMLKAILDSRKINLSGSKAIIAKSIFGKDSFRNVLFISFGNSDADKATINSLSYNNTNFSCFFEKNDEINKENTFNFFESLMHSRNNKLQLNKVSDLEVLLQNKGIFSSIIISEGHLSNQTEKMIESYLKRNRSAIVVDYNNENRFPQFGKRSITNEELTAFNKTASKFNNEMIDLFRKATIDIANFRLKSTGSVDEKSATLISLVKNIESLERKNSISSLKIELK